MSIFIIKIIACVTMVLDHIKYAIPNTNNFITQYFGRISFPLFAFMIAEGYSHTKNLKKYYIRLLIVAIFSQVPFYFFRSIVDGQKMLNIFFTLMCGLATITIYDNVKEKYLAFPMISGIIALGYRINVDYRMVWNFNDIFVIHFKK